METPFVSFRVGACDDTIGVSLGVRDAIRKLPKGALRVVSAHPRMASSRLDDIPHRLRLLSYPRERGDDLNGSLFLSVGIRGRPEHFRIGNAPILKDREIFSNHIESHRAFGRFTLDRNCSNIQSNKQRDRSKTQNGGTPDNG